MRHEKNSTNFQYNWIELEVKAVIVVTVKSTGKKQYGEEASPFDWGKFRICGGWPNYYKDPFNSHAWGSWWLGNLPALYYLKWLPLDLSNWKSMQLACQFSFCVSWVLWSTHHRILLLTKSLVLKKVVRILEAVYYSVYGIFTIVSVSIKCLPLPKREWIEGCAVGLQQDTIVLPFTTEPSSTS